MGGDYHVSTIGVNEDRMSDSRKMRTWGGLLLGVFTVGFGDKSRSDQQLGIEIEMELGIGGVQARFQKKRKGQAVLRPARVIQSECSVSILQEEVRLLCFDPLR